MASHKARLLAAILGAASLGCGGDDGGGAAATPTPTPTPVATNPIEATGEREPMTFPNLANSELIAVINSYISNANVWDSAQNPQNTFTIPTDVNNGVYSIRKVYNAMFENATGSTLSGVDVVVREGNLNDVINYHTLLGEISPGAYNINTSFSPISGADQNVLYVLNENVNTYQLLERIARTHSKIMGTNHAANVPGGTINDYTVVPPQTMNQLLNALSTDQRAVAVEEAKGYAFASWLVPDAEQFAGEQHQHAAYINPANADQLGRNVFWQVRQAHRQAAPGNDANGFLTLYNDNAAWVSANGDTATLFTDYLNGALEAELTALRQLVPNSVAWNAKKGSIETNLEVTLL